MNDKSSDPDFVAAARNTAASMLMDPRVQIHFDQDSGIDRKAFTLLVASAMLHQVVVALGEAAGRPPKDSMVMGMKTYLMMFDAHVEIDEVPMSLM
jgi:hypothetical protein